jgi:hypothetical protein
LIRRPAVHAQDGRTADECSRRRPYSTGPGPEERAKPPEASEDQLNSREAKLAIWRLFNSTQTASGERIGAPSRSRDGQDQIGVPARKSSSLGSACERHQAQSSRGTTQHRAADPKNA